jgi:hypothetical protein
MMTGNFQYGIGEMIEGHANIPYLFLDESRIELDDAVQFIDQEVLTHYSAYLWLDPSTPTNMRLFLKSHWQLELVTTQVFTFTPLAEIYRVTGIVSQ